MEKATKEKGITLIALIITIIVMLILVGVTVSVALNGGLFSKAKEAVAETDEARIQEEMQGAILAALDSNGNIELNKLKQEIDKIKGIASVEGNTFPLKVKDESGNEWTIKENGTIETKEPEVEKVITAEDEEYAYWKTDGSGTIVYYDLPDDKEVPETLIVPCKIGDEKITKIGMYALCGDKYNRNDDGSLILSEGGSPTESDGYPPTRLKEVKNIIISRGITEIDMYGFAWCNLLEKITIPSTVTIIGEYTFADCESLTNISIPEGVTTIGDYAFSGIAIRQITIPKGVTKIGEGLFGYCISLETINLPSGITDISYNAFSGCEALKEISLPEGLTTIGGEAFSGCTSIKKIYIPESVDNMGYAVFAYWTSEQTIEMGKTEEPALVGDYWDPYQEIGWSCSWKGGNANVVWGK